MNIFVLDSDPIKAARYHNDRHVVKMILESAQLLSTAHVVLDGLDVAKERVPVILRESHRHHPAAVWTRTTSANYKWVHALMGELLAEYIRRYDKTHSYAPLHTHLALTPANITNGGLTPFPQCMPELYKRKDAVEAYRFYYFSAKRHIANWKTGVPTWWKEMKLKEGSQQ